MFLLFYYVNKANNEATLPRKCISMDSIKSLRDSNGHQIFFDFSLTVKAVPHECVIRTGLS